MARIHKSMTELVGNTPLLELVNYEEANGLGAHLIAKLEYFNPNQSAKDRIAVRIIRDAEAKGLLHKGDTIVETSSGNTGIALAAVAASLGYKFRCYLQPGVSRERYQSIEAFGAEAVDYSTVPLVKELVEKEGDDFFMALRALKEAIRDDHKVFFADQCFNESNPDAYEASLGPEIWEDTDGAVDILVASVGTGGTITGTGRYLKSRNDGIQIIAVQPSESTVPTRDNKNPDGITGIHRYTDVPKENRSTTLDESIIDAVYSVEPEDAYRTARAVAESDGVLLGESSGAAIYLAAQLAARPENREKNIVVIAPDTGLRYFSTKLFERKAAQ